jgi:hypothetical protein
LFSYFGKQHAADFRANRTQIILPVYENGILEIAIQSDAKTRKALQLRLAVAPQTAALKISAKPYQSGDVSVAIRFEHFRYGRTVGPLQDVFTESVSVDAVLDFALHGLLVKWCERGDVVPPVEFFLLAADLCVRFSIGATHFFTKLADKFIAGFCESGSYIEAFVPVVFSYFAAVAAICPVSKADSAFPDRVEVFLRERVPPILVAQLNRPELVEKPAINSLLMLMSLYEEPERIETFFADVLSKSVANVVQSILASLEFVPADSPPSAEVAELYCARYPDEAAPMVTIAIDSVIQAADLMLVRCRTITTFFTKETMPMFADSQSGILADFSGIAFRLATIFAAADPPPPDQQTFRFLATYRQLWQVTGSTAERSPARLFDNVIGRWLSDFGDALIVRLGRAIALDDFSLQSQRKLTSSSITDLFAILHASFTFIEGMHFSREETGVNVMAYLALCGSGVRDYTSELFSLFFACFDRYGLTNRLAGNRWSSERQLTEQQLFVLLNDLIALRGEWVDFTRKFSEKYGVDTAQLPDPMHGVLNRVKSSLQLFGCKVADDVKRVVYDTLFILKKSKGKPVFELKPKVLDEAGALGELVVDELHRHVGPMKEFFAVSYRMRLAVELLRGVELGLLESLIPFEDFSKSEIFWGVMEAFHEVIDECFRYFERTLDRGDYEYLVQHRESTDGYELLDFVWKNRQTPANALKDLLIEWKDSEAKKFLISVIMKQQKKAAGFKRSANFSFYVN